MLVARWVIARLFVLAQVPVVVVPIVNVVVELMAVWVGAGNAGIGVVTQCTVLAFRFAFRTK